MHSSDSIFSTVWGNSLRGDVVESIGDTEPIPFLLVCNRYIYFPTQPKDYLLNLRLGL